MALPDNVAARGLILPTATVTRSHEEITRRARPSHGPGTRAEAGGPENQQLAVQAIAKAHAAARPRRDQATRYGAWAQDPGYPGRAGQRSSWLADRDRHGGEVPVAGIQKCPAGPDRAADVRVGEPGAAEFPAGLAVGEQVRVIDHDGARRGERGDRRGELVLAEVRLLERPRDAGQRR